MGKIGIIGGTGVYDPSWVENAKPEKVHTPYGPTSDLVTTGIFQDKEVVFLLRHGISHTIPPHKINFKANIYALKEMGVDKIIATAAVGSLKEDYKPKDIVVPDQFIDMGKDITTFYDEGQFYHVSMADPFCNELRTHLVNTSKLLSIKSHETGTYLRVSGPQFSTRSASSMFRRHADIIGMTVVPEAILAREKEMCFACLAAITDYDCWAAKPVSSEEVKSTMAENLDKLKRILERSIKDMPDNFNCNCQNALKDAAA